jgi:uncharacterized membrane protein YjjP (DUF1212 family)
MTLLKDVEQVTAEVGRLSDEVRGLRVDLAVLKTKVALYSAIGSLVGAGVVSAAVAWLSKGGVA